MSGSLDEHVDAYQGGSEYDRDNAVMQEWYTERILALSRGASSMLELGLGHGRTASVFTECVDRHVVLEGSPAVIELFKQQHSACSSEIVNTLFEAFTTAERFDVVVLGFVLEHVDDPGFVLDHYRRLVAPGGSMFIAVPNAESLNRRLGHAMGLLPDMEALSAHDRLLGHKRYYTVETLTEEIQNAGCKLLQIEGLFLKPFTSSQMQSLALDPAVYVALCDAGSQYPELSCGLLARVC